jgi:hypothetical protein
MTYEHSRLAKKEGKRPKRMKSAESSLFRLIFLEIRLGTNAQMYQGHKTLRLRSEMCLLKKLIISFRANPQSCP